MKILLFIVFSVISCFAQGRYGDTSSADATPHNPVLWTRSGTTIRTNTSGDDIIISGKLDLGIPGTGSGLDIGEGGSYQVSAGGDTIVYVFTYDSSATSGSRFSRHSLNATITVGNSGGDRIYIGSTIKFWAARFNVTQAKSSEVFEGFYWNGSDSTSMDIMGIKKDAAISVGEAVLQQTSEKEYITWDNAIDSDWATADNQLNRIPNVGTSLYWIWLQVPSGNLATALIVNEIKARGTDFDFVTASSYPVFWGKARVERHENISLSVVKVPGGTTTAEIDITSAHKATVFVFDGAGDNLTFGWDLPEGIDTSSKIEIKMTYSSNAADTYTIDLTALKIKNATTIGAGVSASYTSTTNITTASANVVYTNTTLTATKMSIQNMNAEDSISFEIQRTDASNTFYPISITIHYIIFSTGEHV